MKKNSILLSFIMIIGINYIAFSQQKTESGMGIDVTGYIKTDIFYDTRQTVAYREGQFFLYPANELLDKNGNDLNAKQNFNILSIQSRLTGKITGPDFLGAKTSGLLEGEFFGTSDGDINGFRIRHAFVQLDFENTSLMVGQYWHPMFVAEVFPGVVSFNTGAPFQPFSRNPQIRITQSINGFKIIGAIASQRDFQSNGPSGFSSTYLRNAVIPDANLQLQLKFSDNIIGLGGEYKKIQPRLFTQKNNQTYETNEMVESNAVMAYLKLNYKPITFKCEGVYGSNLADMLMLGGYAVKTTDTLTGRETYTTLGMYSIWGELIVGKELEFAVFSGYTKNLGAKDNIDGAYYTRVSNSNIDNVLRVSPRIQWNTGKLRLSGELEYTSAAYGTVSNSDKGKVINTKQIADYRLLLALYLFF
ncbi:MAG: hypothetical protein ABSG15_03075 [FCB group bacterium]|jgi:hypothetical protein